MDSDLTVTEQTTITSSNEDDRDRRLFVGNLPLDCTQARLEREFGVYGRIETIDIVKDKYGFVTFETTKSVQDAIQAYQQEKTNNMHNSYKVGRARASPRRTRTKKEPHRNKADIRIQQQLQHITTRLDEIVASSSSTTPNKPRHAVVVQCNTSHLSRLLAYVKEQYSWFKAIGPLSLGGKKIMSLLLLEFLNDCQEDVTLYASRLAHDVYLKPALNQVFVVSPKYYCHEKQPREQQDTWSKKLLQQALEDLMEPTTDCKLQDMVLRVSVFPPRLQGPITVTLDKDMRLALSPTNFTHVFSILQIHSSNAKYYLMGLSKATSFFGHLNDKQSGNEQKDRAPPPPRAYYKLVEAFGRYKNNNDETFLLQSLRDKVAMDCGAAPGGWTRFLVQHGCRKVYSIDPGEMEPSVLNHKQVIHLRMKFKDALSHLQKSQQQNEDLAAGTTTKDKIDVYVSDMCLHDMTDQIDMMLLAKPLLQPNALFCVTLKCVAGYTQKSYNYQVEKVVRNLKEKNHAFGIQSLHLFANRNAERTIMGYFP